MNKEEIIDYVKGLGGIETPKGWNVPKSVNLYNENLTEIPIQFNIVEGNFYCHYNKLTSLKGCPKVVEGGFSCLNNYLTSYKFAPKVLKGLFLCDKGDFRGKDYYGFLLKEKVITESEYLLAVI